MLSLTSVESSTSSSWLSDITDQLVDITFKLWLISCIHECNIVTIFSNLFVLG